MNVLVMSISNKVPMLKSVKDAMSRTNSESRLFGADTSDDGVGQYFVDRFWKCPRIEELEIDLLINFCLRNEITVIIPSRDGELPYFAQNREILKSEGINVMISDAEAVDICIDKLLFYKRLNAAGYPVIHTSEDLDFKSQLYVVKERYGAGSAKVGIALDKTDAEQHAKLLANPIFQPYIFGMEYSVDSYVDHNNKTKGTVVRHRKKVVNGESQITVSIRDEQSEQMYSTLAEYLRLRGHAVFQFIKGMDGQSHIIECNCRFGGASSLGVAMGLDSFYWFMQESLGMKSGQLPFRRSTTDKTLIRHTEDLLI